MNYSGDLRSRRLFLFPFRERSLPFLTVNATIGNQAFSRDRRNNKYGLWISYNMANNIFLNSSREKEVEAQVEFLTRLKLWKGLGSPVIDVSLKKDSWIVYVAKLFGIRRVERERLGYETSGFYPWLRLSSFLIETLSITGQKFSKCLENCSDRVRKGQLRWSWQREAQKSNMFKHIIAKQKRKKILSVFRSCA